MTKIELTDAHEKKIREHGEDGYPHEICGALLGSFGEEHILVEELHRLENLRDERRERRYEVTPKDQLKAQQRADERDLDVVGFYHSHPDHPACPSQYDLDHAWPRYVYAIVSVRNGNADDLNFWQLSDDESEFNQLKTISTSTPASSS